MVYFKKKCAFPFTVIHLILEFFFTYTFVGDKIQDNLQLVCKFSSYIEELTSGSVQDTHLHFKYPHGLGTMSFAGILLSY